jgi:hypothetical protein
VTQLLSPCHNKPIYVTATGYDDDLTIWCSEEKCYNTWDKKGEQE